MMFRDKDIVIPVSVLAVVCIGILSILFLIIPQLVLATTMSSSNFQVQSGTFGTGGTDNSSSGSFSQQSVVGEAAVGSGGSSENFQSEGGFQKTLGTTEEGSDPESQPLSIGGSGPLGLFGTVNTSSSSEEVITSKGDATISLNIDGENKPEENTKIESIELIDKSVPAPLFDVEVSVSDNILTSNWERPFSLFVLEDYQWVYPPLLFVVVIVIFTLWFYKKRRRLRDSQELMEETIEDTAKEKQIADLKAKADALMRKYVVEYQALDDRSEKLHDEQEVLEKEYKALDTKTGLNVVLEEIAKLKEPE